MAMYLDSINNSVSKVVTKRLRDMTRGEVCCIIDINKYVINIGLGWPDIDSRFLILDNDEDARWYQPSTREYDWDIKVRELRDDESVTLTFGK